MIDWKLISVEFAESARLWWRAARSSDYEIAERAFCKMRSALSMIPDEIYTEGNAIEKQADRMAQQANSANNEAIAWGKETPIYAMQEAAEAAEAAAEAAEAADWQ